MIPLLFGISAFGFLGLSILCPLLALPGYYFCNKSAHGKKKLFGSSRSTSPSSIDVLIPAHNEAAVIESTLMSIHRSIEHLLSYPFRGSPPSIKIHVGADHCTDSTSQIARQFSNVLVTEFREKRGKWTTLKTLCAASSAEWIILVDAGALWPIGFLKDLIQQISQRPDVIAFSPAYRPMGAGWLHHLSWAIEKVLKRVEVFCGGPVSVHGATICYNALTLKETLVYLGDTCWVNDDVVIPLMLRTLHPDGVILYPVGEIRDAGLQVNTLDVGRRKRLLMGNLQWLKTLWPCCFRQNPIVGIVAIRRLFRVLWAYWFALVALALVLSVHLLLPAIVILGILMMISGSCRQLAGAALVSLLAPFRALQITPQWQENWK